MHGCLDGKVVFPLGPDAKADPLGRCACVLFFGNQLALLPSRDTEHLNVAQDDGPSCQAASVGGSCILHLHTLGIQDINQLFLDNTSHLYVLPHRFSILFFSTDTMSQFYSSCMSPLQHGQHSTGSLSITYRLVQSKRVMT